MYAGPAQVQPCEADNGRRTKAYFCEQGAPTLSALPPLPSTTATFYVLTEGESCLARRERERRRRECGPLFSNCLYVSLTASVPRPSTMEAIVCLQEKAWVFFFFGCFDHFSKSNV